MGSSLQKNDPIFHRHIKIHMASITIPPSTSEETPAMLRHSVDAVVVPLGLGIFASMFLLGGVTVATQSYFNKFEDRLFFKLLVVFIWCMMVAHVIFGVLTVHDTVVVHYGDYNNLGSYPKFIHVNLIFSGLIPVTSHSFFTYRLWKLTRSLIIPLLCWTLMIALFGLVLSMDILLMTAPQSERTIHFFTEAHRPLVVATLVISVAIDLVISTSLISYLWLQRAGIFVRTRKVVDRIILWTLQTGLLTSAFTVAMLVAHLTMDNFVWLGIMYAKPGLFAISVLASLNGRQSTSDALQESIDGSILFPPLSSQGVHRSMTVNITTAHLTVSSEAGKAIPSKEALMSTSVSC
ncbi:hypothetical protein DL96DRAFT_1626104 [Flagelloscypha sp. PMI_526]|nr:hypothetical protein DL96DRAFT_1626104 [Flagelloscypha sp. PMI_526]